MRSASAAVAIGTNYLNFDPFGRPAKVDAADGSDTLFSYLGARVVTRTAEVWGDSGDVTSTNVEEFDRQGRLYQVTDGNNTITRYVYDAGGRLSSVCMKRLDSPAARVAASPTTAADYC